MLGVKLSSGIVSASAIIFTGRCYYYGFTVVTGDASFTVTLYDGLSATGTEIENYVTDAGKEMDGHSHAIPVVCAWGIYANLGGGDVIVYYSPIN